MTDHPFSQLSDIAPGNEASVSSDIDEAQVLQLIKETPSEEDVPRHSVGIDPKRSSVFLEDLEAASRELKSLDLHEHLLAKST